MVGEGVVPVYLRLELGWPGIPRRNRQIRGLLVAGSCTVGGGYLGGGRRGIWEVGGGYMGGGRICSTNNVAIYYMISSCYF